MKFRIGADSVAVAGSGSASRSRIIALQCKGMVASTRVSQEHQSSEVVFAGTPRGPERHSS
jgi:hypothetical protein